MRSHVKISPAAGDEFEMLLFVLSQEVSFGRLHLQIARAIAKTASDKPQTLQCAQEFFGLTFRAHLESAYARAARLFDPKSGTATIASVLEMAEQKAGTFQHAKATDVRTLVGTWERRIAAIHPLLRKLHDLRNGLMAHLDRKVILDSQEMRQRVAVTFDDIDQVLGVANEILSTALGAYIDSVYFHELPSTPDHEALFRILESVDAGTG